MLLSWRLRGGWAGVGRVFWIFAGVCFESGVVAVEIEVGVGVVDWIGGVEEAAVVRKG